MLCVKCDSIIPEARVKLGYNTCLKCGEVNAQSVIAKKKGHVFSSYNKGGLQYNPSIKLSDTLDARRQLFSDIPDVEKVVIKTSKKVKRKPIAVVYLTVEDRLSNSGLMIFDENDARLLKAHRVVYYD